MDAGADASRPPRDSAPAAPELDRDRDGVLDADDAFPDDPSEWQDSDGNGVGNAAQADEDGDGVPDVDDEAPLDPTRSAIEAVAVGSDGTVVALPPGLPARLSVTVDSLGPLALATLPLTEGQRLGFRAEAAEIADVEVFATDPAGVVRALDALPLAAGADRAWTWIVPETATYEITVVDAQASGAPITLWVFEDADSDGAADALETALGMRPFDPDPDGDGLADGLEIRGLTADLDGDGLAGWLDRDSDGDTISDRVEGWLDSDGDGTPDLLDLDSDNSGVIDADEAGVPTAPADTDGDGTADFRDLDDDNDGLLDVRDPAPTTVDAPAEGFSRGGDPLYLDAAAGDFGADSVPGAARTGQVLRLRGGGFSTDAATAVIRYADGSLENIDATRVSSSEMTLVPSLSGAATIALRQAGLTTNTLDLAVLPDGAPVLFPPSDVAIANFGSLTIRGENLDQVSRLLTETGDLTQAVLETDGSLRIGGASLELVGSTLRAVTNHGTYSNSVAVRVLDRFGLQPEVPAGAVYSLADLSLTVRGDEVISAPSSGSTWVLSGSFGRNSVVHATVPDANPVLAEVLVLQTIVGASIAPHEINAETTAATLALQLNQAFSRLAEDDLAAVFGEARANADVRTLAARIATEAAARTDYLEQPSAAFTADLDRALLAVEPLIEARVPRFPQPLIREGAITPAAEQSDVRVFQTDRESGNLSVENDTSLYLSAEVRSVDGRLMQAHVDNYVSLDMVAPQRGLLLGFYASTGRLSAPSGRNAEIDVVTPGVAGPSPTGARAENAQFYLRLRTAVDRIIIPIVSEVFGNRVPGSYLIRLILLHNYDAIQDVRSAFSSGEVTDALFALVNILLRDAENVGPITRALAHHIFGGSVAARTTELIARRFVTEVNPITNLLSRIGTLGTAVGIGKAVADFVTTPGLLQWRIAFGLEVLGHTPFSLERRRRLQQVCLSGVGFRAEDGTPVEVTGRDVSADVPVGIEGLSVNEEGSELCFFPARNDIARVDVSIELTITRPDTADSATHRIPVNSTLRAVIISPPIPQAMGVVRLDGAGFGTDRRNVHVRFVRPSDGVEHAQVPVREVHGTWLTFDVPAAVITDPYDLVVVVGTTGAEELSNPLGINVAPRSNVGTWEVSLRGGWQRYSHPLGRCVEGSASVSFRVVVPPLTMPASLYYVELLSQHGNRGPGPSDCLYFASTGGGFPGTVYASWATGGVGHFSSCGNVLPEDLNWSGIFRRDQVRSLRRSTPGPPCNSWFQVGEVSFSPATP